MHHRPVDGPDSEVPEAQEAQEALRRSCYLVCQFLEGETELFTLETL